MCSRFFTKINPMKNILVGLLLISSLCSFTKKKKKPEQAFKKGNITAIVGTGYPNPYRKRGDKSAGPFFAAGEWQASRRWSFGLIYSCNFVSTGVKNYTVYTQDTSGWVSTASFQYQDRMIFHAFTATAQYCYINRGRVCVGSGLGLAVIPNPTIKTRFPDGTDHSWQMRDRGYVLLGIRIRLIDAKVRLNKNWGVCGGVGFGDDGFLTVGASYTFRGRE